MSTRLALLYISTFLISAISTEKSVLRAKRSNLDCLCSEANSCNCQPTLSNQQQQQNQYPVHVRPMSCVNNCVQNCVEDQVQRCQQYCQQSCDQSAGVPPYGSTISNNGPIYLRPGSSPLAPNIPVSGNTNTQPSQSFPPNVPVVGGATGTSSTNTICIDICMPSCTQQCVSQQQYAPSVIENPTPITGGQPAIGIAQGTGSVMPPQNVPLSPQGPIPVIPEGPRPVMVPPQYTTEQPMMSGPTVCFPICMPTCNSQCIQQNAPQPTQAPIYVTPQPTYDPFPQTLTPAIQQCINICMPTCSTQCIQSQQQAVRPLPEPAPIPPQLAPTPTQPPLTLQQQQTTQCNPSTIGNDCACPRGFVICVTPSGSNQCCRKR